MCALPTRLCFTCTTVPWQIVCSTEQLGSTVVAKPDILHLYCLPIIITVISSVRGSEQAFSHHQQTNHSPWPTIQGGTVFCVHNVLHITISHHMNTCSWFIRVCLINASMAVALNSLFIQLHFIADTLVVHQGSLTNKKSVVQVGIAHYLLPSQFSNWCETDQIVGLCVQSQSCKRSVSKGCCLPTHLWFSLFVLCWLVYHHQEIKDMFRFSFKALDIGSLGYVFAWNGREKA